MKKQKNQSTDIATIIRMAEDERRKVQMEINSNPIRINRQEFVKTEKERSVIREVKHEQTAKFQNQLIARITL